MKLKLTLSIFVLTLSVFLCRDTPVNANCTEQCGGNPRCIAESTSCPKGDINALPVLPPPPPRNVIRDNWEADPANRSYIPLRPPGVEPPAPIDESPVNPPPPQFIPQSPNYTPIIPRTGPTRPRPVAPIVYTPAVTCQFENNNYFPGQKRYACHNPRERGVCEADAGYGIPYICDGSGNWSQGNDGLAECAVECQLNNTSYTEATCVYSEARDDGQGYLCFAGTGGYGFNPNEGCSYSYGPVDCPVLPDEQPTEEPIDNTPIPEDQPYNTEPEPFYSQENTCTGEISSICGGDGSNTVSISWSATPIQGDGTCNIYIRDGNGDHTISNECSGSWSGIELPNGDPILGDSSYELYISNGIDHCLNAFASSTQLSCPVPEGSGEETWGILNPAVDWVEEWL